MGGAGSCTGADPSTVRRLTPASATARATSDAGADLETSSAVTRLTWGAGLPTQVLPCLDVRHGSGDKPVDLPFASLGGSIARIA